MNPMAQLKDIHLPQEVGLWPLAWGWWVLLIIVIAVITLSVIWLVKRHKMRLAKRQSIEALQQLSAEHTDWPQQVNALLKRAAMVYFPQGTVEPLHSSHLVEFLTTKLPADKQASAKHNFERLQTSLYERKPSLGEFAEIQEQAVNWVKSAPASLPQKIVGGEACLNLPGGGYC